MELRELTERRLRQWKRGAQSSFSTSFVRSWCRNHPRPHLLELLQGECLARILARSESWAVTLKYSLPVHCQRATNVQPTFGSLRSKFSGLVESESCCSAPFP